MYILSIVGARPQFIKAAMITEAVERFNSSYAQCLTHELLHTGQHYDENMSGVFFEELAIPAPKFNLDVGSGTHAQQTGLMLERIEKVLLSEKPDVALLYGDTNSTLSAALAAAKLGIPVAHVEAGLRSYNRSMPEEINRVITDCLSALLFCPTQNAIDNLAKEGIVKGVCLSGDVMLDATLKWRASNRLRISRFQDLGVTSEPYALLTLHRAENTDSIVRLKQVVDALCRLSFPVIFPVHPRTRARLDAEPELAALVQKLKGKETIYMIDPVSYRDMLLLEAHARLVITDSGGVQKESYFLSVPCITLRHETEWMETLQGGWNTLVDPGSVEMLQLANKLWNRNDQMYQEGADLSVFGSGRASENIVQALADMPV